MGFTSPTKLLILCVDRDNDLYMKTKIMSPIIGRSACINAAESLAIADPEEADANAIFAALKEYDQLKLKNYDAEIAIITGEFEGGIESDTKIREELIKVKKIFPAEGIVFVSDGFEDEQLVPILQTIIPIISIRRIIIKHSGRVEESYVILGKYLKMLVFDPRYSRYFLGFPGIFILIFASLVPFGLVDSAILITSLSVGALLLIRGFGIDSFLRRVGRQSPSSYIRIFSVFGMLLIFVVGFYRGFIGLNSTPEFQEVLADPSKLFGLLSFLSGIFLENALSFIEIGAGIYYTGNILYAFIRDNMYKAYRYLIWLVMLVLLYFPLIELSRILKDPNRNPFSIVSTTLLGLSILFILLSFTYLKIAERKRRQE
jgi:putative membrane protein